VSNLVKIYVETTGCAINNYYTEVLKGLLETNGHELVDNIDDADLIVLNACAIKKPTEDKMIARARKLDKLSKILIVSGCLAEVSPERISKAVPKASIISIHHMLEIPNLIEDIVAGKRIIKVGPEDSIEDILLKPRRLENKYIAVVPIAKGCLGACSYCIDKRIWGALKSYPKEKILAEIKRLIKKGVKEIRLSAQDTGPYGWDLGYNLADLLEEISQIPGDFMIRIGMASPDTLIKVIDDVIEVVKQDQRFYRYFHIPVQSGSNRILRLMGRRYNVEEFEDLVRIIRRKLDEDVTIATDIISGFPTEEEEDHIATVELLERIKPDIVNLSRYGDRPGVPASKIYPKVHSGIAKRRTRELSEVIRHISFEKNLKYKGKELEALLLEFKKGGILGRTRNYRIVAIPPNEKISLGLWARIYIEDITWKTLYGRFITYTN